VELRLQINQTTAKKIKALSILTDTNAEEITELISLHIDKLISQEILYHVAGEQTLPAPEATGPDHYKDMPREKEREFSSKESSVVEDEDEVDSNEEFDVAVSMGSKIDELEEEELPENVQNDFKEFEEMGVKNKDGEETGYEDEIMADAQAMAESDEFGDQGSIFADAAGSFGGEKDPDVFGDDTPKEEGGGPSLTPDVLPVDLGIEQASSSKGGMDFFGKVLDGEKGDKAARNKITRKKRK